MQYFITAYDDTDPGAPGRRQNARDAHMAGVKDLIRSGHHLYAAAILNEAGGMIGSTIIAEYPSIEIMREEWLNREPYVTNRVWKTIDIRPCRVPDFFIDKNWLDT